MAKRYRVEPRGGWKLGVKTARPASDLHGPAAPLTAEEEAREAERAARRAQQLEDRLLRRDEQDRRHDPDTELPAQPPERRPSPTGKRRTRDHSDPLESLRSASKPSTSVWVQDNRPRYRKEPADERFAERLVSNGRAVVHDMRSAVLAGYQAVVDLRWVTLTDPYLASPAQVRELSERRSRDFEPGRADLRARTAVAEDGRVVAPPLGLSLRAVRADPALLAVAAGLRGGAADEPAVSADKLRGKEEVYGSAQYWVGRALEELEIAHTQLCLDDPAAALAVERRWSAERADMQREVFGLPHASETQSLLDGMADYHAEGGPVWERIRLDAVVSTALGRDLGIPGCLPSVGSEPRLLDTIRAEDPDSPLLLVPPGVDEAVHEAVVTAALQDVRKVVVASRDDPQLLDSIEGCVLSAVADGHVAYAASVERSRGDAERIGPPAAAARPLTPEERRLGDLVDVVTVRSGSRVPVDGCPGLSVSMDAFCGQRTASPRFAGGDGGLSARRDAAEPLVDRLAASLVAAEDDAGNRPPGDRDAVCARLSTALSAHVFDQVLRAGADPAVDEWVSGVVSAVEVDADRMRVEFDRRVDDRDAAVERVDRVVDAFSAAGVSVVRAAVSPDAPLAPATFRHGDDRDEVCVDPRVLRADDRLTNDRLAENHAELFAAFGRATARWDSGPRAGEAAAFYGAASPAVASRGAFPADSVTAGDAPQQLRSRGLVTAGVREQLVVDAYAHAQMKKAWPDSAAEVTERLDDSRRAGVVISKRLLSAFPSVVDRLVASRAYKHELAESVRGSLAVTDRFVRDLACTPGGGSVPDPPVAPAAAGAAAPDRRPGGREHAEAVSR